MQRYLIAGALLLMAFLGVAIAQAPPELVGTGLVGFALASARKYVAAVTDDAIANDEIRRIEVPSIVNFWAAAVTKTDKIGLFLNKVEIFPASGVNIEVSADVIDTDRDQIVFNAFVGEGQLRVPVTAVTTECQFLLSVEPYLGG